MGLLDGLQPPIKVNRCPIAKAKLNLSDDDSKLLDEAISDSKWPAAVLSVELNKRGIIINRYALMEHRKGVCKCSKI